MDANQAAVAAAVAALVSALTALVSVAAVIISLRLQWLASHPQIKVTQTFSRLLTETTVGESRFCIEVRNTGTLPAVITSVGVIYRRRWPIGEPKIGVLTHARTIVDEYVLPKKLEAGEALDLTVDLDMVIEANGKERISGVWARTAAGGLYRGKNRAKLATLKSGEAQTGS